MEAGFHSKKSNPSLLKFAVLQCFLRESAEKERVLEGITIHMPQDVIQRTIVSGQYSGFFNRLPRKPTSGLLLPDFKPKTVQDCKLRDKQLLIDPDSQKELTDIHKIPKFSGNQASFD